MTTMLSVTIPGQEPPSLSNHKVQEKPIPEIPSHWVFKREGHPSKHKYFCWWPPIHLLHHLLCTISMGHASLHDVWEVSYPGCPVEDWEHGRDSLRERLEHVNVVAGLLLSTTSIISAAVPPDNSILPYTRVGPYCVLLTSVGLSFGGLIVGSAAVFAIHTAKVDWFNETMMGSRFRIWVTMFLLSFPFISIGASTCAAAASLLVAASYSEVTIIRTCGYVLVVPPLLCGIAFGWMLLMRTGFFGRLLMKSVG